MDKKKGNKRSLADKVISDMMVEHLCLARDSIGCVTKLHIDKVHATAIALSDEET